MKKYPHREGIVGLTVGRHLNDDVRELFSQIATQQTAPDYPRGNYPSTTFNNQSTLQDAREEALQSLMLFWKNHPKTRAILLQIATKDNDPEIQFIAIGHLLRSWPTDRENVQRLQAFIAKFDTPKKQKPSTKIINNALQELRYQTYRSRDVLLV